MEDSLRQRKYCLMIGHMQSGKSTLALNLAKTREHCLYIYLRELEVFLASVPQAPFKPVHKNGMIKY